MEQQKYNCLVVDDEPIARKIVISYIERMPLLNLDSEHKNALSAIDYLRNNRDVHIIFLDINMPLISGIDFLKHCLSVTESIAGSK